jgi:hypothetical protein
MGLSTLILDTCTRLEVVKHLVVDRLSGVTKLVTRFNWLDMGINFVGMVEPWNQCKCDGKLTLQ